MSPRTLLHRGWKVAGHALHAPRTPVTFSLLLYGCALALLSWLVGVESIQYPSGRLIDIKLPQFPLPVHPDVTFKFPLQRELGFLAAPNWSVAAIAIWPAMFYVLRAMLDSAERAFGNIDDSPMTWLSNSEPETVASTWAKHKRLLRRLTVLIVAAGMTFSMLEWWKYSGRTLLSDKPPPEGELDWTSLPMGDSPWSDAAQAVFSWLAFLYQGIAIAMIGTFAATTILMARTLGLHGTGQEQPQLLVDIESNDPARRGGFERFVIVIDYMVVFVALAFVNFFFTRIQNAYLRDLNHPSLSDFISKDFLIRDIDRIPELFSIGPTDFSSAAVAIAAVLILFQCFFFFNATLRHTAMQARNRSDHALLREDLRAKTSAAGLPLEQVRERLQNMNVWPLGYSDLMPTLSFLTICVVTMIFYRIGVYLVFLWIAGWIVARAAQGLIRSR